MTKLTPLHADLLGMLIRETKDRQRKILLMEMMDVIKQALAFKGVA